MNGSDGQEVHAMSFRDNGMQAKRRRKPDGGFGVHMRLLLPDSDGGFTMTLLRRSQGSASLPNPHG